MILVFDVGNSETTIGLFDGDVLRAHWRVTTAVDRTADELALLIRQLVAASGQPFSAIEGSAIASVVPALTLPLAEASAQCFGARPVIVDGNSALPIQLVVDEPLTVGADRIVNTLAASVLYRRDTIVVDLGTATTFDCITADGIFLGGVIAPGIRTSADTLVRRTAKLPATEIAAPTHVIGTRTEDCIRAGVVFGAADAIDGIVRRIKRVWPRSTEPWIVATGGLAETIRPFCESIDLVAAQLTLEGLRIAYQILAPSVQGLSTPPAL
jgi:type III pantothenate kinase